MRTISFFCVPVVFGVCVVHTLKCAVCAPIYHMRSSRKDVRCFSLLLCPIPLRQSISLNPRPFTMNKGLPSLFPETDFWFSALQDCKLTSMCCFRPSCFAIHCSRSRCRSKVRNATKLLFYVSLSWGW